MAKKLNPGEAIHPADRQTFIDEVSRVQDSKTVGAYKAGLAAGEGFAMGTAGMCQKSDCCLIGDWAERANRRDAGNEEYRAFALGFLDGVIACKGGEEIAERRQKVTAS